MPGYRDILAFEIVRRRPGTRPIIVSEPRSVAVGGESGEGGMMMKIKFGQKLEMSRGFGRRLG